MLRTIATIIVILNLSSATLHNVMVVAGDEAEQIGTIERGDYRKMEISPRDSIRVIFTLGQEREGWLGTEKMSHCNPCLGDTDHLLCDTIKIDDRTEIFELDVNF